MIPIECPKCGRGGNVPPDRLNARLVCKACHSVFFMDASGRMMLGEPGVPDKNQHKSRSNQQQQGSDFDLAQTIKDIPLAVKIGVPLFLVVLLGWSLDLNPFAAGGPSYQANAETVIHALVDNNKSRVVSLATSSTGEPTGKWFDLMRDQIVKNQVGKDVSISVALFSGNAESDSSITLWCTASSISGGSSTTTPVNIQMIREGNTWKLDGAKTLDEAEKTLKVVPKK